MQCLYCQSGKTQVLDTRAEPEGVNIRRRRKCKKCGVTFATVEHATAEELNVTKRDGRVEAFQPAKLLTSIEKAAFVQPISHDEARRIVERVTLELTEEAKRTPVQPATTQKIAQLVLKHMGASTETQDGVRIRYAIVLNNKEGPEPRLLGSEIVLAWLEQTFPHIELSRRRTTKVVKRRTGEHVDFDINQLIKSIQIVVDGGRTEEQARVLATDIAHEVEKRLKKEKLLTSQQIAVVLLDLLRDTDSIGYLRYASAVKKFRTPEDFYQEAFEQRRHEEAFENRGRQRRR